MIKLVAFDLDSTVSDTIPLSIEAFEKAVSPYAGHTLTREEIVETFGLNEMGMVKRVLKDHWEEALNDYYKNYEAFHGMCEAPFEGIVPLIQRLKEKGITVALITGKSKKSCEISLDKFGIRQLFADVMTGSEYKVSKKDSMVTLMEKYGVTPEEFIYIGDAVSDVTASKEAGVQCYSAAWSDFADKEALEKVNPGYVYESVAGLARELEKRVF